MWKYRNILGRSQPDKRLRTRDCVAFFYIFLVLLYFGGGLVLGILAPDLITIGGIVGNTTDVQSLTSFIPNIGQDPNQYGRLYSSCPLGTDAREEFRRHFLLSTSSP